MGIKVYDSIRVIERDKRQRNPSSNARKKQPPAECPDTLVLNLKKGNGGRHKGMDKQ